MFIFNDGKADCDIIKFMQLKLILVLKKQELLVQILLVDVIMSLPILVMILVMYISDNTKYFYT